MKKIIAMIAVAAVLSACDGYDHNGCRDSVVKEVGTQNVVEVHPWNFVAKDTQGNIWYYETMNASNTHITKKQPLFVAQ
jgi:hypothetical protein